MRTLKLISATVWFAKKNFEMRPSRKMQMISRTSRTGFCLEVCFVLDGRKETDDETWLVKILKSRIKNLVSRKNM